MLDVILITTVVALSWLLLYTVRSLGRSRSGRRSLDSDEAFPGSFDDHAHFDSGGHGESSSADSHGD